MIHNKYTYDNKQFICYDISIMDIKDERTFQLFSLLCDLQHQGTFFHLSTKLNKCTLFAQ